MLHLATEVVEEVEHQGGQHDCHIDVLVVVRESIHHDVVLPWIEFHNKAIPEKLAYPGVLWDDGEALIQQVLEGVMIGADNEGSCPQVRSLVLHYLNKPDELVVICHKLGMPWHHMPAIEGDEPIVLLQDGAKSLARAIAIDNETVVKVWELRALPLVIPCFNKVKKKSASGDQTKASFLSSWVNGRAMTP